MLKELSKALLEKLYENAIFKTIATVISYFFLILIVSALLLNFTYNNIALNYIFTYVIVSIIYIIRHSYILDDFKTFKDVTKENYKTIIITFIIGTLSIFAITIFYTHVLHVVSTNEIEVEEQINNARLLMGFVFIFLAPICEELTFRSILTDLNKNKNLCAIISSILFALSHVIASTSLIAGVLYLIPYTIMGYMFAFNINKTNNALVSIPMHMAYNLVNFVILCI